MENEEFPPQVSVRDSKLAFALLALSLSIFALLFCAFSIVSAGLSDTTRGLVQTLNLFNVLLGGESLPLLESDHNPVTPLLVFGLSFSTLFCFWWVIAELTRKYSDPRTQISK